MQTILSAIVGCSCTHAPQSPLPKRIVRRSKKLDLQANGRAASVIADTAIHVTGGRQPHDYILHTLPRSKIDGRSRLSCKMLTVLPPNVAIRCNLHQELTGIKIIDDEFPLEVGAYGNRFRRSRARPRDSHASSWDRLCGPHTNDSTFDRAFRC